MPLTLTMDDDLLMDSLAPPQNHTYKQDTEDSSKSDASL